MSQCEIFLGGQNTVGICTEKQTKMDATSIRCGYVVMLQLPEKHRGDQTSSQCWRKGYQLDDAEVGHGQ